MKETFSKRVSFNRLSRSAQSTQDPEDEPPSASPLGPKPIPSYLESASCVMLMPRIAETHTIQ